LLVWSEFPAAYVFNDKAIEKTTIEWLKIVRQHYNHPSIITWVPFNESWGVSEILNNTQQQKFTDSLYYLTKAIDPMRLVVANDGWEHTTSDIITLHDYEELGAIISNINLYSERAKRPVKQKNDKSNVLLDKIMILLYNDSVSKNYF